MLTILNQHPCWHILPQVKVYSLVELSFRKAEELRRSSKERVNVLSLLRRASKGAIPCWGEPLEWWLRYLAIMPPQQPPPWKAHERSVFWEREETLEQDGQGRALGIPLEELVYLAGERSVWTFPQRLLLPIPKPGHRRPGQVWWKSWLSQPCNEGNCFSVSQSQVWLSYQGNHLCETDLPPVSFSSTNPVSAAPKLKL